MDVKKVALLVGALVIAVVTAVLAKNMFAGAGADQAAAAPVPTGPKVLVARKPLPVGTIIDAESLIFQAWPKELVQNAYYTEGAPDADISKLLGTVVRNEITAGQPLTRGSIVAPGDRGFLAAALGPGMRAVTVPTDEKTGGVGGFIFPGDRVDLMLTQDVAGGGEGPPLKVSETIVRNLRVLAIDQRVDSKTEEGKTQILKAETVTLEATPRIAEKIAVARNMGTLTLSLRSIADNTAELERAVASGEVKVPAGTNPAEERRMLLAVANRPSDNNTTYVTGGDVSRFQRRSVPARDRSVQEAGDQMTKFAAAMGRAISGKDPAAPEGGSVSGPGVRVARGNNVTVVPVGAR